jgi:hypothetical protein
MGSRVAMLLLAALAVAGAALAQEPAEGERRQVSDTRVLSVTGHCFYGPHLDEAQAKRLCGYQVRANLLDKAASKFGAEPAVRDGRLMGKELRAFVDSLLVVDTLDEEARTVADGLALRLTLRGELRQGKLADQVAAFQADGQARTAALAETARRDRLAGEARLAAVPFEAEREFAAGSGAQAMSVQTALATRRLVRGMTMASVKGLLGNPGGYKQSVIDADTYVCAAYDRLWVVLRDGVVACARTRLEYSGRFGTDCHCFGSNDSILNLN